MSTKRLGAALARANALAGQNPTPSRHDHDHEQEKTIKVDKTPKIHRIPLNNSNPSKQDQDHENAHERNSLAGVDAQGRPITKGRTSLARIVNSDPTFLMAQDDMGIRADGLVYHCKRLGVDRVRKIILHFSTWNKAYFTNMAGYIMGVMKNAAPGSTDPIGTRRTADYQRWLAENGHTK